MYVFLFRKVAKYCLSAQTRISKYIQIWFREGKMGAKKKLSGEDSFFQWFVGWVLVDQKLICFDTGIDFNFGNIHFDGLATCLLCYQMGEFKLEGFNGSFGAK